ncbi:MAG TPA: alpha/beta hydrolase [Candidatus Eisenbacteria bacterium]|nr:alpha/beta hydrolase [Candidatus Eisenbacteria bacterium]
MDAAIAMMIAVSGASVWAESAGTGPAVVFLHAGVADSRMWDAEFDALRTKHRVVRLDLRGFGRSQLVPGTFSYHGDVAAVMESLHVDRATVVGCSFGSNVALDFALAYPARVERLVLVSPSIGDGAESPDIRAFGEREEAALERGDLDGAVEENLRFWVDGPQRGPGEVDPEVRRLVGTMQRLAFENPTPDGVKLDRLIPPARARLGEIKVPTLIVEGSLDVPHVLGVARRLREGIPGARLETIEGTAHLPTLEKPERWRKLLTEFLDSP